jgi:rhamnogalacturonyl hydrolase YesR
MGPVPERETEAIRAAWEFIAAARNVYSRSAFYGTYYGCYDLTCGTYRLGSWVWCTALVIDAMLTQARSVESASLAAAWRRVADGVGQFLLKRWEDESRSPVGGMVVRWDMSETSPIGIVPWRAPNDVAFIGAYGFLPLYQGTGRSEYLAAALDIGHWIVGTSLLADGRVLVGYRDDLGVWDRTWVYIDVGFTGRLFSELYLATGDSLWRASLSSFANWYVRAFSTGPGHFRWTWPRRIWQRKHRVFTRGQAWALDGVLAAYEILGHKRYLDVALNCVSRLLSAQASDGSWSYLLDIPSSGPDNKGVPVLAYHLLRMYGLTGDRALRDSAQRALDWCDRHQALGPGVPFEARGGIVSLNEEGSITGKAQAATAFVYAAASYIMARHLEKDLV